MKSSVQLVVSLALLGFLLGVESAPPSPEADSEASPDSKVLPQIMRVDLPEQEILALQDRLRKTRQISPQALLQQQSPASNVSPQLDAQQRLLAEQILRQQLQQRAQQNLLKKQRVQKELEQMLRNQIKEQQVLKQKLEREIFNEQLKAKARQAERAIADKKAMQQRAVLPENILLQRQLLNDKAYSGQPKVQVQREIVPADQLLFDLEVDQLPQEQFLQPSYRPGPSQAAVSAGPLVVPGNAGGGSNYFQTPRNLNGYDGPAQYSFEYKVQDAQYANDFGHRETRDGDRTEGTYYVNLPDGRLQRVDYYVTGDSGFVADVTYQGEPQYPQGPAGGYGPVQPNYA